MSTINPPIIEAQMLIRRPIAEVFEAFVNPDITTKFWFTKASGWLEPEKIVRWDWEMFGVGDDVKVKALEPNEKILIEWDEPPCPVEWKFESRGDKATLVKISNWGFHGSDDEVVAQAIDSKGGFTMVLAGLKAWLEHGVILDLVRDQFPDGYAQ
jgi:uncharacterized protein YndB with AHSA1/START domain